MSQIPSLSAEGIMMKLPAATFGLKEPLRKKDMDALGRMLKGLPPNEKAEVKAVDRLSRNLHQLREQKKRVEEGLREGHCIPLALRSKNFTLEIGRHERALEALVEQGKPNQVVANLLEEQILDNQCLINQQEAESTECTKEYTVVSRFIQAETGKLKVSMVDKIAGTGVYSSFEARQIDREIRKAHPELFAGQNGSGLPKADKQSQAALTRERQVIKERRRFFSARQIAEEALQFGANDLEKYHVLKHAENKAREDWRGKMSQYDKVIDQYKTDNNSLDEIIFHLGFKPRREAREALVKERMAKESEDITDRYRLLLGFYKNSPQALEQHLVESYLDLKKKRAETERTLAAVEQSINKDQDLRWSLKREASRIGIMTYELSLLFEAHKAAQNGRIRADLTLAGFADLSQKTPPQPAAIPSPPKIDRLQIVSHALSSVGGREADEDAYGRAHRLPVLAPGVQLNYPKNVERYRAFAQIVQGLTITDETGQEIPLNLSAENIVANAVQLRELTDKGVFGGLRIVCDGMGGAAAGEVASSIAVVVIQQEILKSVQAGDITPQALRKAVEVANKAVYAYGEKNHNDAGTTVVATLTGKDGTTHMATVGDSRAYFVAPDGTITQVGTDHSLVTDLALRGTVKPSELHTHDQRNFIMRNVGEKKDIAVDLHTVKMIPGSKIILTCDGVWEGILHNITIDPIYAQRLPLILADVDQEFARNVPIFTRQYQQQGFDPQKAQVEAYKTALQIANGRIFREINLYGLPPNATPEQIVQHLTRTKVGMASGDNVTALCMEAKAPTNQ
jgi:serine/threonine protein phosphatase PrpC